MPQPLGFTRAFAELVSLLVYRPGASDEQKLALRAALLDSRDEGVVVSLAELNRATAAAASLPSAPTELPWLTELAARMAGHSVGLLHVSAGAKAGDVLGVARALATSPVLGDEGAAFDARTQALQLTTVVVRLGRGGFVRRPTPIAMARVPLATPARTPAKDVPSVAGPALMSRPTGLSRPVGIGVAAPTVPAPTVPAPTVPTTRVSTTHVPMPDAPASGAAAAPRVPTPRSAPVGDGALAGTRDERRMVEAAFTQRGRRSGVDEQLVRLDRALDGATASALLADLSRTCEDMARDGRWAGVAQLMHAIVAREATVEDADVKRAFLINLRRLFKPAVLRGLAQLLARRRDLRPTIEGLFVRSGDAGADLLVDLLVASNVASERRAYRTALAQCPAAAEPLMHLLQDPRWYVVRNAAELLGEMGVAEADGKLIAVLRHGDARVRRSAAGALARIGTARGVHAVQPLLADRNAAVRLQAVHAITSARLPRSVPSLLQALEREDDPGIQHALLSSLGAHPTHEAVTRLTEAAQPGSLLHRKATAYRMAAVHALGEAGTPAALAALRALQNDRDREVRLGVERALASHAQGVVALR